MRVRGSVQGVGSAFRLPAGARRTTHRLGLNDAEGVLLEVQGAPDAWRGSRTACSTDAPPLARVLEVQATPATAWHPMAGFPSWPAAAAW
jgi:hydrogenase maturation factor HypF (carbamoyltransferase family)